MPRFLGLPEPGAELPNALAFKRASKAHGE